MLDAFIEDLTNRFEFEEEQQLKTPIEQLMALDRTPGGIILTAYLQSFSFLKKEPT